MSNIGGHRRSAPANPGSRPHEITAVVGASTTGQELHVIRGSQLYEGLNGLVVGSSHRRVTPCLSPPKCRSRHRHAGSGEPGFLRNTVSLWSVPGTIAT